MDSSRLSRKAGLALLTALAVTMSGAPWAAWAGVILNPTDGSMSQIEFYEPIGQTFTAEDPFVLASLYYTPINPQVANSDQIRLTLYSGAGVAGSVLGSDTFSLADGFSGFRDSDFSSIALTVGNVYTIAAEVIGTSAYWAAGGLSPTYAGGAAVFQSVIDPNADLAFRITPVAAAPEPGTLALLGLGLAGLAASRRRSKQ